MRQGPLDPGSTLDWAEAERMQEQRTATIEEAEDLRDQLCAKVRSKRANSYEIAELLARAKRSNAHEPLTCASFGQFAVRFGAATSETKARELVKTWELLQELPPLLDVARKGEASWSNLKEAARAATKETAAAWVGPVLSESYDEVRARAQRALDEEPTRRWSAELLLTTHARLRRWVQAQSEKLGRRLTGDDALDLLLATAERAAGPSNADGQADGPSLPAPAARLVFYANAEHTRAEVEGSAGPIELAREELEELECDAEHQHGDGKVTPSIPAKIRRVVFARDRGRCAVPGCGALGFLHEHHVGEGGRRKTGHDPETLTLLCAGHHRLVHRGWLRIEGTYTLGFRFLDARGVELPPKRRESILAPPDRSAPRPRGRSPDLDESIARGFGKLGLKITEARELVAHARRELPDDVDADTLVATALRSMPTPGRR